MVKVHFLAETAGICPLHEHILEESEGHPARVRGDLSKGNQRVDVSRLSYKEV